VIVAAAVVPAAEAAVDVVADAADGRVAAAVDAVGVPAAVAAEGEGTKLLSHGYSRIARINREGPQKLAVLFLLVNAAESRNRELENPGYNKLSQRSNAEVPRESRCSRIPTLRKSRHGGAASFVVVPRLRLRYRGRLLTGIVFVQRARSASSAARSRSTGYRDSCSSEKRIPEVEIQHS
jgi:hypothetical protein